MKKLMKVFVMVMMLCSTTVVSAASYELTDGSVTYELTDGIRKQPIKSCERNVKENKSVEEKLEAITEDVVEFDDSFVFGSDAELYEPHEAGAITGYTECIDKTADINKVIGSAIQEFENTTDVDQSIGTSFSVRQYNNILEYKLISLTETCFIKVDLQGYVISVTRITH